MLTAWKHGHSVEENDVPPALKAALGDFRQKCIELIVNTNRDFGNERIFNALSQVADTAFYSLCCLGADAPDEVFQWVAEMNGEQIMRNWRRIGLLIGNASQKRQKELLNKCVDHSVNGNRIWMDILGIAVWRAENLVRELPADTFGQLCSEVIDVLAREPVIREDRENGKNFVSPFTISRLELFLGLLRSRESKSKRVRSVLAVGSPLARRLEKIVEEIDDRILESGLPLQSRISLQMTNKPGGVRSHDLLYALTAFLTGYTGAQTISVANIDDNEGS
jgi:hypothetical protein